MTETNTPADGADAPLLPITDDDLVDLADSTRALVGRAISSGQYRLPYGATLKYVAEEILGEALQTACEKASEYDRSRSVVAWVLGFAALKLLSRYRDESRRNIPPLSALIGDTADDPFGALDEKNTEAEANTLIDVERMLQDLKAHNGHGSSNAQHVDILSRRYLNGDTVMVIALDLDLSENAVHQRISRARDKARQVLGLA